MSLFLRRSGNPCLNVSKSLDGAAFFSRLIHTDSLELASNKLPRSKLSASLTTREKIRSGEVLGFVQLS